MGFLQLDEMEEEILKKKVKSIMEAVFNDKADTLWKKYLTLLKLELLMFHILPHIINHNEVVTVRDKTKY